MLELIFTVTPAERGAILLADSGVEDFASVFGLHRSGRQEKSVSVSRSIAQRAMREGVGALSAGVADDASPQSLHGAGAQSATEFILPEDLPDDVLESEATGADTPNNQEEIAAPVVIGPAPKYHEAVREAKKAIIVNAIEQSFGNYVEAARLLGLHPNNLYRLIRNLNLKSRLKKQP